MTLQAQGGTIWCYGYSSTSTGTVYGAYLVDSGVGYSLLQHLYYRIPELLRLWKFVLYLIVAKVEMTKLLLQYPSVIISLGPVI